MKLGVENVLDEDPPAAGGVQGFSEQFYDMRGRFNYRQFGYRTTRASTGG